MLSEVVSEIAAFLKDWSTAAMSAFEIEFHSHGLRIAHFDCLVPATRDTFKSFRLRTLTILSDGITLRSSTISDLMY
jgi:hypothetical protein